MPIGNRSIEPEKYDEESKDMIPENISSVTAEELEALLKEILTG